MVAFVNALSFALLLTGIFAFRFGLWRRWGLLAGYFSLFFVLELVAQIYWLPPGALGIGVAYVCFPLAVVFLWLADVADRRERLVDESSTDS